MLLATVWPVFWKVIRPVANPSGLTADPVPRTNIPARSVTTKVTFLPDLISQSSKLPAVNAEGPNPDNRKNDLTANANFFQPVKLSRQLLGALCTFIGIILAGISHFALLYSRWPYPGWRRLGIGIPGWILAAGFIWHGASILLNP